MSTSLNSSENITHTKNTKKFLPTIENYFVYFFQNISKTKDIEFTGVLETLFMYKQFKHFAINYLCLSLLFA